METINHNWEFELGERATWGGRFPFCIGYPSLDQHIALLGTSGCGKSTLLRNLISQLCDGGFGTAVIDPHGDLARDVLEVFPTSRADDLLYFDAADEDHPIGFNVLADVQPRERARVAASVVAAFKAAFGDSWGPRLQRLLHFSVATLLECQNVTLLAIPRLLVDEQYRDRLVRNVHDPVLAAFWRDEFDAYDKRFRSEIVDPVLNKLGRFAVVPALRNVLGQVSNRVDLRYIMDHKKVLIANLGTGLLGEDAAALLGALLVSMFHAAAMSRADTAEHERPRFTLICDEYGTFATESFTSILSQARKYRLQLVLASQHLALVDESIRAAVSGNVGTWITFRVGEADARVIAREFGEVYPPSFYRELRNFEVVVKNATGSFDTEPFRANTHAPMGTPHRRGDRLIRHSRERYATERAVVEDRLLRWLRN